MCIELGKELKDNHETYSNFAQNGESGFSKL
jgi:hypothetical protein